MYYKQINHKVSRLISHNTYYIGCVFPFEAVLPPLWMSTKQIPIIAAGLRWKVHHWNFFLFVFFLTNSAQYSISCMLFVEVNNSAMKLVISSRTRFMFSNRAHSHTILPFQGMAKSEVSDLPCSLCLLSPLFIAPPPSNEKSFELYDRFDSQLCYGVLNQETSLEKNPHMGLMLRLKSVIL